jgi:hypothetical protein
MGSVFTPDGSCFAADFNKMGLVVSRMKTLRMLLLFGTAVFFVSCTRFLPPLVSIAHFSPKERKGVKPLLCLAWRLTALLRETAASPQPTEHFPGISWYEM